MYHWNGKWRESADFIDATFENAAIGIAHVGLDGAWLRVNERLLEIVGYERDELLAITFQDITHPDDLETDLGQLQALIRGEIPHYQMEKRYFRKDGELIWINLTVGLQRGPDGAPDFCISLIEDITRRKADEEHLRILVDELNHRVKNTLATVQAVAHMSFRKDEPVAEAKKDFTGRLQALSSAHDILTEEKWTGADFRQVVRRALRPFNLDNADRLSLEGGKVRLESRQALTLAMAINELATNAIKYGALSTEQGSVALRWRRIRGEDGVAFRFEWTERGGPRCAAPERSGFGSTLLTRILPGDFGGKAVLDYRETGLKYILSAPWPGEAG
ncbi:PAS domain S-box protein [Parasphingopyxis algicola]|uniref:sensor histidine kinase n=1 Tax=Parasphingopyxis algicola TaxID=2026624 RepID=UPI0015A40B21|nr:sensor histidine kinase [Parasphingopyxis algicola]QLC25986.1 PAS domain S-box protein [Parasphingopyxis algicola]